jgi:hypothetical protein
MFRVVSPGARRCARNVFPLTLACATALGAQRLDVNAFPPSVTADVVRIYNDQGTTRRTGPFAVPRDSVVSGALAVRNGPVSIAGHVNGAVLVINGDLTFADGAVVDGGVLVVGGRVEGRDRANVNGDMRVYAEALRYRLSGEELVVEDEPRAGSAGATRASSDARTRFDFSLGIGENRYNRVEGLSAVIGPRIRVRRDWGTMSAQTLGIVRTAEPMRWGPQTIGYDARAEVRRGYGGGFAVGASAYDRIEPVERWQLTDNEAGMAAFFLHRDFRDYYARHGGGGVVRAFLNSSTSMSIAYVRERWASRDARDPWTLFRDNSGWPENPVMDDGIAKLATLGFCLSDWGCIDPRSRRFRPSSEWYVQADVERGEFTPSPGNAEELALLAPQPERTYTRGLLDVRRYNRIAPRAQINLRVLLAGWLSGDELPLQRRLSVSGPGALAGFDYRRHTGGEDRLQCSGGSEPASALPALCDRIALAQIEYRGSLSWETRSTTHRRWPTQISAPVWTIFADAGRGWRAHSDPTPSGEQGNSGPVQGFPALSTFKTDLGAGIDFGGLSVSVVKALSDPKESANVIVRLNRRF